MKKANCYRVALAMLVSSCAISSSQAGVVTGPPLSTFQTSDNSKDIALTPGSSTFTADLSSYTAFISNVYSVVGYGTGAVGTADVLHQSGSTDDTFGEVPSPYFMVGRDANGELGTVVYKFVLPTGDVTGSGATVNANVYFRGEPDTMGANEYIGVNNTIDISSNDVEINDINDFSKVTMESVFNDNTNYASYFQNNVSLAIPAGLNQFYVVAADDGSNGRFALSSLSINGNVVAAPEPGSVALVGGLATLFLRRRAR